MNEKKPDKQIEGGAKGGLGLRWTNRGNEGPTELHFNGSRTKLDRREKGDVVGLR